MTVFKKNWLRTSFWKKLIGKYTSPELDPDLAVKIRIRQKGPYPDPQH
jgi:hypothetical protein